MAITAAQANKIYHDRHDLTEEVVSSLVLTLLKAISMKITDASEFMLEISIPIDQMHKPIKEGLIGGLQDLGFKVLEQEFEIVISWGDSDLREMSSRQKPSTKNRMIML